MANDTKPSETDHAGGLPANTGNDELARFVADMASLSTQIRDPALADRIGPCLVQHVQAIAAAVRQRFVSPPAIAPTPAGDRH